VVLLEVYTNTSSSTKSLTDWDVWSLDLVLPSYQPSNTLLVVARRGVHLFHVRRDSPLRARHSASAVGRRPGARSAGHFRIEVSALLTTSAIEPPFSRRGGLLPGACAPAEGSLPNWRRSNLVMFDPPPASLLAITR